MNKSKALKGTLCAIISEIIFGLSYILQKMLRMLQVVFYSVLAFFLCNSAINNIGVNGAATFFGISTVVSIITGTILLKEVFPFMQFIGALLIIIGVLIANITIEKPQSRG